MWLKYEIEGISDIGESVLTERNTMMALEKKDDCSEQILRRTGERSQVMLRVQVSLKAQVCGGLSPPATAHQKGKAEAAENADELIVEVMGKNRTNQPG